MREFTNYSLKMYWQATSPKKFGWKKKFHPIDLGKIMQRTKTSTMSFNPQRTWRPKSD